jgi:glyoxylase-like metal-dependent hydrolase (beta-lactamase superfamily II)
MQIITLPVGNLEANCYIIVDEDTNKAAIIDPGDEPDRILEAAEGLDVEFILLTHAHFDHAGAVGEIKEATDATIAMHADEVPVYDAMQDMAGYWGFQVPKPPAPDIILAEGEEVLIGSMTLAVIHTPGHTPGGICFYTPGTVFTGDTLFAGSIGRTDFPGGSYQQIGASFRKLMGLPSETKVYSGHGPVTSIGREKTTNMFAEEFLGA